MDAGQTARAAGITYRQLDHWTRRGWLRPAPRPLERSGMVRDYPGTEVRAAVVMGRLVAAGMGPGRAAALADRARTSSYLTSNRPPPILLQLTEHVAVTVNVVVS